MRKIKLSTVRRRKYNEYSCYMHAADTTYMEPYTINLTYDFKSCHICGKYPIPIYDIVTKSHKGVVCEGCGFNKGLKQPNVFNDKYFLQSICDEWNEREDDPASWLGNKKCYSGGKK